MNTTRIGDLAAMPGLYVLKSQINCRLDGPIELLHVISVHAGGEIRGYKRPVDSDGPWKLRTPSYPMDWPEVDAAVADLVRQQVNGADFDRGGVQLALGVLSLLLALALGSVGCAHGPAPAPEVESVGALAGGSSVYSAPLKHDAPPSLGFVAGSDDDVSSVATTVTRAGDAGSDDAAPAVVVKDQGLTLGTVR